MALSIVKEITIEDSDRSAAKVTPSAARRVKEAVARAMKRRIGGALRFTCAEVADALDVEERLVRCVRDGERGCRVELGLRVLAFCGQDAMDEALASVGYCGARPIEATDEVTPDRALTHLLETSAALAKAWEDRRLTNDEKAHVAKLIRNLLPVLGDLLRQTSEEAG
jgi:hypothetical protein